eukprot:TRINITY_DN7821_c2_g1_i1.p1 TRINITY_DN7821_c2_g1~~TRINITY_DN7821_c2_g1_i1.p1  ORF type:complete len:344 (-),score=85.52 TRINITY_DN7821_c2_g1_i1:149-1180(-)
MALLRAFPSRITSRWWGQFNELELPPAINQPLLRLYARMFGCKLEEMEAESLEEFKNLQQFFTRSIKPECRPVASAPVVSPVDGRVMAVGEVRKSMAEQIKGVRYHIDDILGESARAAIGKLPRDVQLRIKEEEKRSSVAAEKAKADNEQQQEKEKEKEKATQKGGKQAAKAVAGRGKKNTKLMHAIIYLAPGDYHGIHAPADMTVSLRRHMPGHLLSVAPLFARWYPGLFATNERVVLRGEWEHGYFAMIPVGAQNVGSIALEAEKDFRTNLAAHNKALSGRVVFEKAYSSPLEWQKGERVAFFHLGSTVVLVFEVDKDFEFSIQAGDKLRLGQSIGEIKKE